MADILCASSHNNSINILSYSD